MRGPLLRRALLFAASALVAGSAIAAVAIAPAANASTGQPATASTAAPAGANGRLRVTVPAAHILTLPARDGFRDSLRVAVTGTAGWKVDVAAIRVGHDRTTVQLARRVTVKSAGASVSVPVRLLTAGRWTIRVTRSGHRATTARAATQVVVGSGRIRHLTVTTAERTYYPFRDGYRDTVQATVVATDETGAAVPFHGTLRLRRGGTTHTAALRATTTSISTVGLGIGTAALVARAAGPAGAAVSSAPVRVLLKTTGVASVHLAASSPTVEPIVDGQLDSVTFTVSGTATAAVPIRASGSLSVERDSDGAVAMTTALTGISTTKVVWDGRLDGDVVPGDYTATAVLQGPDGLLRSASTTVTVSAEHLDYRAQDLFAIGSGNQQGIAVHDGTFFVATDLGNGSSRIDLYDARGTLTRTLGALPIGHGAELSYSTTNGMLYAANGGMVAGTVVYGIDPNATDPAATMQQFDLTSLGPNGMVAVDDANQRLVVFAGNPGAYTISFLGLDGSAVSTAPMPVSINGLPQGIEMVDGQIWIYSSSAADNTIDRFTTDGTTVTPVGGPDGVITLAWHGEGEGLAYDPDATPPAGTTSPVPGVVYIGAHSTNRVGALVAVTVPTPAS